MSKLSEVKMDCSNCFCKRPRRPKYNACSAACPSKDACTVPADFCSHCNKKLVADARDYLKPSFKRVFKCILTLFVIIYVFRDEAYCCRRIANSAAVYSILVDIVFKAFCHFLLKKYE
ncbi:uncharacterized protein LOC106669126 isoform X2 [Cimex lectularius]|uniref:Uncharacterized protein n=1 Tax=Cimex lectularius TaxID=79782 RepID=A0A8I6RYB5_CIMLE|nr:uncharacterized protein LOC106669126 isoform X2 [Cimex lectularius]